MAVFLINQCKFENCGLVFSSLSDLIQHIEDVHIAETTPRIVMCEEPLTGISASYILRLFTEPKTGSGPIPAATPTHVNRQRLKSLSPVPSLNSHRSSTPTESELDEADHEANCKSDDSWLFQEEVSTEVILRLVMLEGGREGCKEKPFACPVPGCKKKYKNINGIKYHAKHGHKRDSRTKDIYRCKCGKSYKSPSGLRQHNSTCSMGEPLLSRVSTLIGSGNTSEAQTVQSLRQSTFSLPIKTKVPISFISSALRDGGAKVLAKTGQELPSGMFTLSIPPRGMQIALPVGERGILKLPPVSNIESQPISGGQ